MSLFETGYESLNSLVAEYRSLESSSVAAAETVLQRLKIC